MIRDARDRNANKIYRASFSFKQQREMCAIAIAGCGIRCGADCDVVDVGALLLSRSPGKFST